MLDSKDAIIYVYLNLESNINRISMLALSYFYFRVDMKIYNFILVLSWTGASYAQSDADVTHYCEDKCTTQCYDCNTPRRCTDEQTDCGFGAPDPKFGGICPPHSICVDKGFHCNSVIYIYLL